MIVGVSCDSEAENKAFRDKFDFPFDLLCDTDRTMSLAYGAVSNQAGGYPSRISYLIGPDAKVLRAYASVSPGSHADEVLEDLP